MDRGQAPMRLECNSIYVLPKNHSSDIFSVVVDNNFNFCVIQRQISIYIVGRCPEAKKYWNRGRQPEIQYTQILYTQIEYTQMQYTQIQYACIETVYIHTLYIHTLYKHTLYIDTLYIDTLNIDAPPRGKQYTQIKHT